MAVDSNNKCTAYCPVSGSLGAFGSCAPVPVSPRPRLSPLLRATARRTRTVPSCAPGHFLTRPRCRSCSLLRSCTGVDPNATYVGTDVYDGKSVDVWEWQEKVGGRSRSAGGATAPPSSPRAPCPARRASSASCRPPSSSWTPAAAAPSPSARPSTSPPSGRTWDGPTPPVRHTWPRAASPCLTDPLLSVAGNTFTAGTPSASLFDVTGISSCPKSKKCGNNGVQVRPESPAPEVACAGVTRCTGPQGHARVRRPAACGAHGAPVRSSQGTRRPVVMALVGLWRRCSCQRSRVDSRGRWPLGIWPSRQPSLGEVSDPGGAMSYPVQG